MHNQWKLTQCLWERDNLWWDSAALQCWAEVKKHVWARDPKQLQSHFWEAIIWPLGWRSIRLHLQSNKLHVENCSWRVTVLAGEGRGAGGQGGGVMQPDGPPWGSSSLTWLSDWNYLQHSSTLLVEAQGNVKLLCMWNRELAWKANTSQFVYKMQGVEIKFFFSCLSPH